MELTLEEAAFGVEKEITFTAQAVCPECEGVGTADASSVKACADCGGRGQVRTVRRTMLGQFIQTGMCPRCMGTGQIIEQPCEACRGAGRRPAERKVTVQIPAGIDHGQRIRVTGKGGAGERGQRSGDLYVHVSVLPHEIFERHGDDILTTVDLTMVQAALGVTLTVPTLDGDEELEFAAGTQPGDVKVLRSKGVQHLNGHGRGDQAIHVRIIVPRDLDENHRRMLEEFDESVGSRALRRAPRGRASQTAQLLLRLMGGAPLEADRSVRISVPRSLAEAAGAILMDSLGPVRGGAGVAGWPAAVRARSGGGAARPGVLSAGRRPHHPR